MVRGCGDGGFGSAGAGAVDGAAGAHARLIEQGTFNGEACRQVGVNRKTGTRWRFERSVPAASGPPLQYPAVITTVPRPMSPRYPSEDQRVVIADLPRAGATVREIGAELGRAPSTVSRELARNADPATWRYRPARSHRLAAERRAWPRRRRVDRDPSPSSRSPHLAERPPPTHPSEASAPLRMRASRTAAGFTRPAVSVRSR